MLLLLGFAAGCSSPPPGPVPVAVPVTAASGAAATGAACAALARALPERLGGQLRRRTSPASARVAAWGSPPVVLRCGVGRPPGYRPPDVIPVAVDDVAWYQHIGGRSVQWVTVDRAVYVELDVPKSYDAQAGFLVDMGAAIRTTLPPTASPSATASRRPTPRPTGTH